MSASACLKFSEFCSVGRQNMQGAVHSVEGPGKSASKDHHTLDIYVYRLSSGIRLHLQQCIYAYVYE